MLPLVYFLLLVWTMFWGLVLSFGLWHELARVRTDPRADLFAVIRAYAGPAGRVTCSVGLAWGWLPAAVLGAMWLAGA